MARLEMATRRELSRQYARRYLKADRKGKGQILTEFCNLFHYSRKYSSFLLSKWGKKVYIKRKSSVMTVIVGEFCKRQYPSERKKKYGDDVILVLIMVWVVMNGACGKRLKEALPDMLHKARLFKEISISDEVYAKLEEISASTIDRLLRTERKKYEIKCRDRTKPGSLLKKQIEIRTGTEWDEDEVGYVEIDLVSHDGGNTRGDFCQTLTVVDVKSGWVEMEAIRNKAQIWTVEALEHIRERLPFPLQGIDSDNGSEFINKHLFRYCQDGHITFTRSRSSHKNDGCHVEEKNYTAVRTYVGYNRYDQEPEQALLNQIYANLRLYLNFFHPSMKLISKSREGSKIIKKYEKAQTPYRRLINENLISPQKAQQLKKQYDELNPFELKRSIDARCNELAILVHRKQKGLYYDMLKCEQNASIL